MSRLIDVEDLEVFNYLEDISVDNSDTGFKVVFVSAS